MSRNGAVEERRVLARRLPPQPSSVPVARRLVRELLAGAGREDLLEAAQLLVSEIVTNAMLHAGTVIDVRASLQEDGLRVEIGDGSPHLPTRRRYAPTAGTGRGVMLLERLVDDWGVTRHDDGKTVWFRLSTAGLDRAPAPEPSPQETGDRHEEQCVDVRLENMPLLLQAAWQEHAEALLREYLLAHLDEPGGVDPVQVHAEATDAIAVLAEHVPHVEVTVEPDHLMQGATEPGVSAKVLRLPVPVSSVAHFDTLDRAIEDALALAGQGLVLTPPTQPEIRAFRHWLCRQVRDQADGATPVPWSMEAEPPPQGGELDWDLSPVRTAAAALVAADDRSRILAVSRSALRLLGYDDEQELVGRRIVSIIPDRYRQAHIAGFTLFLLVGRRPLLGTPVVVPALRRDGAEVTVRLTVTARPAGEGRSVFVADLAPAG